MIYGIAITPDARRIASVSGDKTLRVWDIPAELLAAADKQQKYGYMNAKVVLLGESGAGKTGLALRLWHDRWKKTDSTHGMEIQRLTLPEAGEEEGVTREVWLWDLAGQTDYRLVHQLYMEQTALALLVFDPQRDDVFSTLAYWQAALKKIAGRTEPPGILVAARCDRPNLRLTMQEMEQWAAQRGLRGPILTAAKLKKHPGAAELRDLIAGLIPWERIEFRSTMENFPPLKDAILAVRDAKGAGGAVVTPAELEARVSKAAPKLKFTAEDLRAVTGLLAGEGVVSRLPYGGLVLLQPQWLNCYASTLVKMAGEDTERLGHVPLAVIQPGKLPNDDGTPRLPLEDESQLLPDLVSTFIKRALAWQQDTDRGAMLVFPNYVRLPRLLPPPRPGRTVLYRFSGALEEIYCTLVVRLHYGGLFKKVTLYRYAADFETHTGELAAVTMREAGEKGELEIYFGKDLHADVQAAFQTFVDDHLRQRASEVERLRTFHCPKCHEEVTDRRAIDTALTRKNPKLVCQYCDPENKPGVINLNDVLEQQYASRAGEEEAGKMSRKASQGISDASKEQVMVGEVMAIVASADQIFRSILVRDEGVDGEIEFNNAKGRGTRRKLDLQLKSGDSHLRPRKDGTEVFPMKGHYERYWGDDGSVPVYLLIRTSDGVIRYMNATAAIKAAQKTSKGKKVSQIDFTGEVFDKAAVLALRERIMC